MTEIRAAKRACDSSTVNIEGRILDDISSIVLLYVFTMKERERERERENETNARNENLIRT